MYEKLAIIISQLLNTEGRLLYLLFPRGTPRELLEGIVREVNAIHDTGSGRAILVCPAADPKLPAVPPEAALAYRAGSRLFVWEEGNFDPDSSFGSTVEPVIVPGFPETGTGLFELPSLCAGIAKFLKKRHGEVMTESDWRRLQDSLCEATSFHASVMGAIGNADLARWTRGWWELVAVLVNRLDDVLGQFDDYKDQLDPGQLGYSAAGLPRPRGNAGYTLLRHKRYCDSLEENWANAEKIAWSLDYLERSGVENPGLFDVFKAMPWDELGGRVLSTRHPVLAIGGLEANGGAVETVLAWSGIYEHEFLLQKEGKTKTSPVMEASVGGVDLSGPGGESSPAWIVPMADAARENDGSNTVFRVEKFQLRVETSEQPGELTTNQAYWPAVKCTGSNVHFEVESVEYDVGVLVVAGTFEVTAKKRGKWPDKPVRISLDTSRSPLVEGIVNTSAHCRLLVPDPWRSHSLYFATTTGKSKKRTVYLASGGDYTLVDGEPVPVEEPGTELIELPDLVSGNIYAYPGSGSPTGEGLACLGKQSQSDDQWPDLQVIYDCAISDDTEVAPAGYSGDPLARFVIASPGDLPWHPVSAAALGKVPRPMNEQPPVASRESLLGDLEQLFTDAARATLGKAGVPDGGLFQCAIPAGRDGHFKDEALNDAPPVKWLARGEQFFPMQAGQGPSAGLLGSSEAGAFWNAFRRLIKEVSGQFLDATHPWFCRSQLREVDEDIVEEYLEAFANLVAKADTLSSEDAFWARYPFSVFIHDEQNHTQLQGVLLSPMHPVRVGWLYAAEKAAYESQVDEDGASRVSQVIDGWNFPWFGRGPGNEFTQSWLVAMPIDPGDELLFIGWSYLCNLQATASQPSIPAWAVGRKLPGASLSGLTASSVGAAIRDYIAVNPYLSTFNVELSANSRTARSRELDHAVLSEMGSLLSDKESLPGGIRVHDSMNREGDPPRWDDAFSRMPVLRERTVPLEWKRFSPSSPPRPDLRFLEDGQVNISIDQGERWGALPAWPVKRFAVTARQGGMFMQHAFLPEDGDGWDSFRKALGAFELFNQQVFSLSAQPGNSHLVADGADWNVTGNINVSPAQFAEIARANNGLLWEWRPGYLPRRGGIGDAKRLNTRPYVTIARIPTPFKAKIRDKLSLSDDQVEILLTELGTRGIGLSSLLAMGHHNDEGALGFYYGFKLLDLLPAMEGVSQIIVPIDAVDVLLRAIAGSEAADKSRRADLLLIEVFHATQEIVFVPIEIRCSKQSGNAPGVDSNMVREKLEQLEDTLSVLETLATLFNGNDGGATRKKSLYYATLASIIECGLLLSPGAPSGALASEILNSLLAGEFEVKARKGVLFWFQHVQDERYEWYPSRPEPEHGCLFIDHRACEDLWNAGGDGSEQMTQAMCAIASWLHEAETVPPGKVIPVELTRATRLSQPSLPGGSEESGGQDSAESDEGGHQPAREHAVAPVVEKSDESTLPGTVEGSDDGSEENTLAVDDIARGKKRTVGVTHVEQATVDRPVVYLGQDSRGFKVEWDPYHPAKRLANAHTVILGTSGSGKTQTLKVFISELSRQGVVPVLLDFKDDYVDQEFRSAIGAELRDAMDDGLPYNPLKLERDTLTGNVNVMKQVMALASTLKKVHNLGDQQEAELKKCMFALYERSGVGRKDRVVDPDFIPPGFDELSELLENSKQQKLLNRVSPLFDLGLFDDGNETLAEVLSRPTVVRFSQLPSEEIKKVAAEIFLRGIYNHVISLDHVNGLRMMIVIDEAHKIANLEAIRLLLKEARAYGVSVFLSTQEPTDFEDFVFANANSLLTLKLTEQKQAEQMAMQLVGHAKRQQVGGGIQRLLPFQGYFKNDHFQDPYSEVRVVPYYERTEGPG